MEKNYFTLTAMVRGKGEILGIMYCRSQLPSGFAATIRRSLAQFVIFLRTKLYDAV